MFNNASMNWLKLSHIITTPTYSNAHLNKISHEINDDKKEDFPYQEVVGSFMFVVISSHQNGNNFFPKPQKYIHLDNTILILLFIWREPK
jgi:hypothetical protein